MPRGDAFGFIYNGEEYYYIKNVQNDIVAIADKNGYIAANYYYDALGNAPQITGDTTWLKRTLCGTEATITTARQVITTSNHAIILPKSAGS